MIRARNCFLIAALAAVGFACGSGGGSPAGTGGAGGNTGASGNAGSAGAGVAGNHGGAGISGTAGTSGGTGGQAGAAGAGTGGQAGSAGASGGAGGHAGASGSGGGGAGGHAGTGGGGAAGQAGAAGHAGAGGHSGGGGAGGAGTACGGIAGLTCGLGEFCDFGDGQCGAGDQQGQCAPAGGAVCPQQPVCGCDGKTYSTACAAHDNGVDTTSTTSCIPGNGGAAAPCGHDSDCMSGYKCCMTGGAVGSPIACRSVGTGACPALP